MATQFCNYSLAGELGRGGMSVVYRAYDQRHAGAPVALKVLASHLLNDSDARARFMVEPHQQLRHAHIVRVLDSGECAGVPYFTMELVDGPSLNDLIVQANARGNTITPQVIDGVLRGTARALEAAHKRGIIHRDIKPSNILIRARDGHAFLMDFGVAQIRVQGAHGEQDNQAPGAGTSDYIAPEQIQGGAVGPAADVYSLGVTIYHALAGRLPFQAEDEIVQVHKHLTEIPPDLFAVNARIPRAVSDVVMRTLQKDPRQRYATAGEFAQRFHRALTHNQPAPMAWPIYAALGSVALLVTGLVVAAMAISATQTNVPPTSTLESRVTSTTRPTPPPTAEIATASASATEPPPDATATLESTLDVTPDNTPAGSPATNFALQAAPLGIERWGKPTAPDGCSHTDDTQPVTRYEVALTLSNNGGATLSGWHVNLFSNHGGPLHKCILVGQEGIAIPAGASYQFKCAVFLDNEALARVELGVADSTQRLCVAGNALVACR
jgi:serine/threonine protein kinase